MTVQYSDLITSALQGDKNGYAKLYQATFRSNFFLANGIIGNDEQAYLIMKEVYTKAFSGLESLSNCNYFPSWVRHLTLMECRNFIEMNMGEFSGIFATYAGEESAPLGEFLPYESIGSDEIRNKIFEIINNLNTAERMVAFLDFCCRKDSAEAAEFLGIMPEVYESKLNSIKHRIKNEVDLFIGNVTPAQPTEESPHIYKVFAKEIKTLSISQEQFKKTFMQVAAITFLAPKAEITPVSVNEFAQPPVAPVASPAPDVKKEAPAKPTQDKRKKIIIGAVAAALAIVVAVVLIFVFKNGKDKEDSSTDISGIELTQETVYADNALIEAIKPYENEYTESLYDFFARNNSKYKDHEFSFGDVDGNGIKDILLIKYEDGNYSLTAITTPKYNFAENYFDYNGNDEYGELLIGEESGVIVIEKDFSIEGTVQNEGFCIYTKFESTQGNEEVLTFVNYFDPNINGFSGRYEYEEKTTGEKKSFNTIEEFNAFAEEFLKGYRKITSGYSIADFVNSGKSLTEFIKSAPAPTVEYPTLAQVPTATQPTDFVNYEWNTSTTLNKYSGLKFFNEDSIIFTMKENGMSGLLDNHGNVLIDAEYKNFTACSYGAYGSKDGYHYAASKDGLSEYFIDTDNYEVTDDPHGGHGGSEEGPPAGLDNLESFNNGLAAALKNGKWGYVDKSYNSVIPFEYDAAETEAYFANEFCREFDGKYVPVRKNGKMGIIDKDNNIVVPFEYSVIMQGEDGVYIAQKDGKWGFICVDGAEYKEPAVAKVPEINQPHKYDWEDDYLQIINDESNINKSFCLTDVDENGVADLVIFDRSSQTDFISIYLNGNISEDDCVMLIGTNLYKSRSDATIGIKSNYHSGLTVSDGYGQYHFFNDEIMHNSSVSAEYVYTDSSFEETESEVFTKMDSKMVDYEIEKEEYEEYVADFEDGFYEIESTFISDFHENDLILSEYYYE